MRHTATTKLHNQAVVMSAPTRMWSAFRVIVGQEVDEMNLETQIGAWEPMGNGVVGREGDGAAVPDEIRLPNGAYILSWIGTEARHVTRIEYHQPSGAIKGQREEALQWIGVLLSDNAIASDMIRQEPPEIDFDMQPFGYVQSWTVHEPEPSSELGVGLGVNLQPVNS